jgi:hypothetical protein
MTFRPFNAETLDELAAIQKELDAIDRLQRDDSLKLVSAAIGLTNAVMDAAKTRLEFERQQIYQADYDLAHKHR